MSAFPPDRPDQLSQVGNLLPRIRGLVHFEWNTAKGTTWYSPGWNELTLYDDYDGERPNQGDWWIKKVHPEDLAKLERNCVAVLTGVVDHMDITFRFLRGDGEWRLFLNRSQVTRRFKDNKPELVSGVCLDVTDFFASGSATNSYSVSTFDYHAMLENSPDLFVRFTRDFKPVYVNPVVTRYLSRDDKDQAITDTAGNVTVSFDQRERLMENVKRVFDEQASFRETVSFRIADGSEICGECSVWPEYEDGEIKYAMVQFRDLTDQLRMARKVTINEQRLEAVYKLTCMEGASEEDVLDFVMDTLMALTGSQSGFFFMPAGDDPRSGYLYWSKDHYAKVGRDRLPCDRLPDDLIASMGEAFLQGPDKIVRNGNGRDPLQTAFDGKMRILRQMIVSAREDNRTVVVAGVCNKTTDYNDADLQQLETFIYNAWLVLRRHRFVRELTEAKQAAEAANKAKDAFLANVSHELRTPLNGVLSMLQLIEGLPLGEEQREYLQTAKTSGSALLRLISDLLDFSIMESGKLPLETDVFDLKETVVSTVNVFLDRARSKGLTLTSVVDPNIPRDLVGDEGRVRQIIFNTVGNAVKFTAEGGIDVACVLLPEDTSGRTGVKLTVTDTGIGIPAEKLSSIFEAFTRMGSSHRKRYSGTGLGLSIVKHLATLMDGDVTAHSVEGQGTRIECTVYFDPPGQAREEPEARSGSCFVSSQSMNILVAEDDMVGRFAIKAFLQRYGHRVVCVEDGEQALETLLLHPFDCMFTDIEMPHLDGLQLVSRIRLGAEDIPPPREAVRQAVREALQAVIPTPVDPDIPVIAVSAHTMPGDRERFLKHGIDHYIAKPIIREELEDALGLVSLVRKKRLAGLMSAL